MAKAARQTVWNELDTVQVASNINRPLGSLEHMFWLIDQNRPVHFAVTALIAGRASPYDWLEALERLQERHSILSVSIEGSPTQELQAKVAAEGITPLDYLRRRCG